MTDLHAFYAARDLVREALERDLLGTAEDERLTEAPLDRFIVGILHPASSELIEDAGAVPDVETGAQGDAEYDPGVNLSRMRYPSSMGMTFAVDPHETPAVVLAVTADRYVPEVVSDATAVGAEAGTTARAARPSAWNRIATGRLERIVDTGSPAAYRIELVDGLGLRVIVRPALDGVVSITAVLVNQFARPPKGPVDEWCWFRPVLEAEPTDGAFSERRYSAAAHILGSDEASVDLLYRDATSTAVGHGCSVTWDSGPGRAVRRVTTTFLPHQDVRVSRADRADVPSLGMRTLGASDDRSALRGLVASYERWIAEQVDKLASLDAPRRRSAEEHLESARHAAARMRRGIDLLEGDPVAARAFRIMNSAMQAQRSRQVMLREHENVPRDVEHLWRPFQMAFILLNLEGLADPRASDRDVADLLWFPTGGGKTEAYLGLIALVLAMRRLRGARGNGGGVGVIMRYTLRLLTLQQFERAAGLVCALEDWRRRELPDAEPVSIGLWVGQSATPNDAKAAAKALRLAAMGGEDDEAGNPRQLLRCPWCGTALPLSAYHADVRLDQVVVRCPNAACTFADGLPVHVVDSDVYRARPSLVIGTVDKFALLAWRERAGRLFGTDGTVDPPDLIVQDELHLISGPLGTLVGLYEMAVDAASTGAARPKLVASTATIRRARAQVRAVFDRQSEQFPPPGIDPDDSFFAVAAPAHELPTRQYVGVMAPGTSHATLMVRTYAALLQAGQDLDVADDVRDAYWTLLGYFNSLRVLGAAYMQTIDDVPDRIAVIAGRGEAEKRDLQGREPRELTSRRRSSEVPEELERLATPYGRDNCPDVVLATNMISVGVDVDRLGLMVVMGQPQTTSEYIQATSRVGRSRPGLVVTLFNAARTRDLSHYESFVPYHRALYRQVEATGATPFAPRAVDRGLHGVLVALARLLIPGAAGETSVGKPLEPEARERLREIVLARVRSVEPNEVERVNEALEALFMHWSTGVAEHVTKYGSWVPASDVLIVPAGGALGGTSQEQLTQFPVSEPAWPTLTSLRNVDAESSLFIAKRKWNRGDEEDR